MEAILLSETSVYFCTGDGIRRIYRCENFKSETYTVTLSKVKGKFSLCIYTKVRREIQRSRLFVEEFGGEAGLVERVAL
jgi:hypothetical protein